MKNLKRKVCTGLLGGALAVSLITPTFAAREVLSVNGQNLWEQAKAHLVENTTYVSLRTLANILAPEAQVSWRSGAAWVEGDGLSLWAKPGNVFLTVNDRVLYIPNGVRLENGSVMVPIRIMAEALGGAVDWSQHEGVSLTVGGGLPEGAPYTEDELYWLARIISAESRGEPLLGKLAVGTVVLNRVACPEFPNSIYGVIFDREWGIQFTPVANGTIYNEPTEESVLAAKMVLDGARVAGDSLYFLAPTLTNNHWIIENREYVTTIGTHWFFK